jgi:hypothetical protein
MKAQEYARQFRTGRMLKEDPETTLRIIFRDFIREANMRVLHKKCQKPEEIAEIFNSQNEKWKEMCVLLMRYRINKDGFLELLRDLEPRAYLGLVAHGLIPLQEKIMSEGDENAGSNENKC